MQTVSPLIFPYRTKDVSLWAIIISGRIFLQVEKIKKQSINDNLKI